LQEKYTDTQRRKTTRDENVQGSSEGGCPMEDSLIFIAIHHIESRKLILDLFLLELLLMMVF
jgi:Ni2+-binding GTPase involved in maturation of urease and hydrogenase